MVKFIKSVIYLLFMTAIVYLSISFVLDNRYLYFILDVIFILYIIGSEREHYSKLIWIMAFIGFPLFAIVLFIAFGEISSSHNVYAKKVLANARFDQYDEFHQPAFWEDNQYLDILNNLGQRKIYNDSNITPLYNGDMKFRALLRAIDEACEYIHMLYYIIKDSNIADLIFAKLINKAQAGVEVRVLFDAVGSKELTISKMHDLRKAGVKIEAFGSYRFAILNSTINFRNHRKIVIIDGKKGFVGGINISSEYIGYSKKYGHWRDIHMLVEGHAVKELQLSFQRDWYFTTKEDFIATDFKKYMTFTKDVNHNDILQIVNNGADYKKVSTKDIYFKLFATAKKQITIITPYFIPDYETVKAITTAAQNNVNVRLFTPGIPDNKVVHSITRTYYQRLLESGVKIFEANDSFLHAKVIIIDDALFTIGTSNIDYRSFNINFEITGFVYSYEKCQEMLMLAKYYEATSTEIHLEKWLKRPLLNKYGANLVQLLAPIF